jgi:hypothetical protein
MDSLLERIETALSAMASTGPRNIREYISRPGPDFELATQNDVDSAINIVLSEDPNSPARLKFSNLLRSWDNAKQAKWAGDTHRNTPARRERIHQLLNSDAELVQRIDDLVPYYSLDEPLIIAEQHQDWYNPRAGVRDYYWSKYLTNLKERRGWNEASLLDMDNSTRAIVECLANPESASSYASRGLVMGYVQSGKTANFAGVVARAADAGYRLIVILAGTWNILRNQTQRRFDKDLLGKELLNKDDTYAVHPPDWTEFLEHGADPVDLGHYTWQRLTRPDGDFKGLKSAIDVLEFPRPNKSLPIYHPTNLHVLPVKLLVIKKNSGILEKLVKDLTNIRTRLNDLPTLVIDDESDQAGINTVDPSRRGGAGQRERSKTNLRIVELLRLFPRGQYVGYTATPYANALVDPEDPEDLFPKDFIISLNRPRGYMGISDCFDPLVDHGDLLKDDYSQPELAHIRRVSTTLGKDDDDLIKALRSFVLAGALKLFREAKDPNRYKETYFKHHTMLVHTSPLKGEHSSLADRVRDLWDRCAHNSPKGLAELGQLWKEDYSRVCAAQRSEIVPDLFTELIPYLSEALKRIEKGSAFYLVINSDSPEAPDFSAGPVWKVILGGNKLSRGYTIEGLTISYYRRVVGTADTLMQMGRWFGFRAGYKDLVRIFLGVVEGKQGKTDLVALFKEVCRMEESFREDIRRYIRTPSGSRITPREIPPLISVTGNLPPTAGNKMFNAKLVDKNFGGRRSMPTLVGSKPESLQENLKITERLLGSARCIGRNMLGGSTSENKNVKADCFVYEARNIDLVRFLKDFQWLESEYVYPERPAEIELQIEFLEKQHHGICSWFILAPQRMQSFGEKQVFGEVATLSVKERHRIAGRGFQVVGEPGHRMIAEFLADAPVKPDHPRLFGDAATALLRKVGLGIMLLYPIREEEKGMVSIGFELQYPPNDLNFDMNFTVQRKSESDRAVVESS